MHDFPGNSQKAKRRTGPEAPPPEERPAIKQITAVPANQRKRGLGRKFRETFVQGTPRDTADYVVTDVIVPAIKDTLIEAFQGGIERLFNGDSSVSRTRRAASSAYPTAPRVDYAGISRYTAPPQASQSAFSRRSRTLQDFGEVIIDSRSDATDVIEQMYEFLSRFGVVHVADLYALTGIQSSHVDHKWGWTSLQGSKAVRMRDGRFLLDLPKPTLLS